MYLLGDDHEISGSTSEIHVHCRTVLIVVNFWRRYSNFCCRLCKLFYFWWINVSGLHVIKGALHILKKNKKKTKGLTIYCISFVNETWFCCLVIFIRYLNGLAALLSITNVVVIKHHFTPFLEKQYSIKVQSFFIIYICLRL
jgi:hypothetical protein